MRPERFELPTYCSGGNRSIQLSYGRVVNTVYMGEQRSSNAEGSARGQEQSWFGLPAIASTAASIAAFAATVAAKTTTAATAALRLRTCFIDIDGAAAHVAVLVVRHFNESEAPRTSGIAVHHDADAIHWPVGLEGLPEFVLICVETEITDKDVFHGAAPALSCRNASSFRRTGRSGGPS